MKPRLVKGGKVEDARGRIIFINDFDLKAVRRFYQISNSSTHIKRGWQGHKIESRWFQAIRGKVKISLIAFENYKIGEPIICNVFELTDKEPQVLYVPPGYASCIQASTLDHCLAVFSDFTLGAIEDEYRFELNFFENIIEEVI